MTVMGDVYNLCQLYNDSGIDKIIIFDLSTDDDEHEKNIHTIENINRNIDIGAVLAKAESISITFTMVLLFQFSVTLLRLNVTWFVP